MVEITFGIFGNSGIDEDIFRGLPSLYTLTLGWHSDMFSVLYHLGLAGHWPTLCPNLTTISIEGDEKSLASIFVLARFRASCGLPLKRLIVVGGGQEPDVDKLRFIIEEVETLDDFVEEQVGLVVAGLWD